jgi:hypothetical protein
VQDHLVFQAETRGEDQAARYHAAKPRKPLRGMLSGQKTIQLRCLHRKQSRSR